MTSASGASLCVAYASPYQARPMRRRVGCVASPLIGRRRPDAFGRRAEGDERKEERHGKKDNLFTTVGCYLADLMGGSSSSFFRVLIPAGAAHV